jgi:hypothetical protein
MPAVSSVNHSLTLYAPGSEPATFDMQRNKLVVRLENGGMQSVYVIDNEGRVAFVLHRHQGEAAFANALVSVGRYLCDQGAL